MVARDRSSRCSRPWNRRHGTSRCQGPAGNPLVLKVLMARRGPRRGPAMPQVPKVTRVPRASRPPQEIGRPRSGGARRSEGGWSPRSNRCRRSGRPGAQEPGLRAARPRTRGRGQGVQEPPGPQGPKDYR